MTICFFNSHKAWGGGEKWHFDMATCLQDKGYQVHFITSRKSVLFSKLDKTEIKLKTICISNLSFLNPYKVFRVKKYLKKNHIQTLIINLPSDLKVAATAAKLAGVKKVLYRRGSAIPIRNTLLNRLLFKYCITEIIANSFETKKTILQNNPNIFDNNKIHIIYNGINLKEYDSLPSEKIFHRTGDEIVIGNAGRMVPQKGQELLIEIAEKLKAANLNFKLIIAGEGKLKDLLHKKVDSHGLSKEVIFPGFISNMKAFMDSIDIFALSSLWEGFGYVIVEAMAGKKPVIAFNTSSNPELVINEKTGFLINDTNIEKFAEKILLLAKDKELRAKFGANGRSLVEEKFIYEKAARELELIISVGEEVDNRQSTVGSR